MSTVGHYVHHVGLGHARRATALAAAVRGRCDVEVTGLSTLPRPADWVGPWVRLPPDEVGEPVDPTAGGRLHWAPRDHPRTLERAAALSRWCEETRPAALVADVSVEATLLARLHGVPVVAVVLPGDRRDPAHVLGHEVADAVVGFWPPTVTDRVLSTAPAVARRVVAVGGHSALAPVEMGTRTPGPPRVVALSGRGGAAWTAQQLDRVRDATAAAGWAWTVLGEGSWVDDPRAVLAAADVVVTHAGQNAVADVATLRRPAVVVPADRPHDEQRCTARALAAGDWPVAVLDGPGGLDQVRAEDWADLLTSVAGLPGGAWTPWSDGRAPQRFADVVAGVLGTEGP